MPSIQDVARDFTALLRDGQFQAAGIKYWAQNIVSIEPDDLPGDIPAIIKGIEAATAKNNYLFGNRRIEDLSIDGPFITGNQFALFLDMRIVDLASSAQQPLTEIALFSVEDGQITEERFFYE